MASDEKFKPSTYSNTQFSFFKNIPKSKPDLAEPSPEVVLRRKDFTVSNEFPKGRIQQIDVTIKDQARKKSKQKVFVNSEAKELMDYMGRRNKLREKRRLNRMRDRARA